MQPLVPSAITSPPDASCTMRKFMKRDRSNSSTPTSPISQQDTSEHSLRAGVASDCNSRFRKTMEDYHSIITPLSVQGAGGPGSGYFAVFDGHAGSQCSQICAGRLYSIIQSEFKSESRPSYVLKNSFPAMDKVLHSQTVANSGTAVAVALVINSSKGRQLCVGNVGDTRVVLSRAGGALRLSYDHRGSDPHEQKRIQNAGGLLINNRVNAVLAVTRALGDFSMKEYVVSDPYTTETPLQSNDEFFIIACDGLWDVCSDQKAVDLVHDIANPQEAAAALIQFALENFSTDNLTVMVVRL